MPRKTSKIKWYAGATSVIIATAGFSAIALGQGNQGPSRNSSPESGSGPSWEQVLPSGQVEHGNGMPPAPPPGSTSYSHSGSGSGKTTESYPAAKDAGVQHSADGGPSQKSSGESSSGPSWEKVLPDGQVERGNGIPPAPPPGSTSYSHTGSGSGKATESYPSP
jgi:hypothetical protein